MTKVVTDDASRDRTYWKRYAGIFAIGLIIANIYSFWPAIAYSGVSFGCPAILGPIWFEVQGAPQVVGPPLYSEMQMIMQVLLPMRQNSIRATTIISRGIIRIIRHPAATLSLNI